MYIINHGVSFDCGFKLDLDDIKKVLLMVEDFVKSLHWSLLYQSIDLKTISAIMGALFCKGIADLTGSIVNPIEKGHPDILPNYALHATEEELRNYPEGLEVKCTIGQVETRSNLKRGQNRIEKLNEITWQAHHQDVKNLLGLIYDFLPLDKENFYYPVITGIFYSSELVVDDWGKISGTKGRNTKVTGLKKSGKEKMGKGWVAIINKKEYIAKYSEILGFDNKIFI